MTKSAPPPPKAPAASPRDICDANFEESLYQAFLTAGICLGERLKGMSCFLSRWKDATPSKRDKR